MSSVESYSAGTLEVLDLSRSTVHVLAHVPVLHTIPTGNAVHFGSKIALWSSLNLEACVWPRPGSERLRQRTGTDPGTAEARKGRWRDGNPLQYWIRTVLCVALASLLSRLASLASPLLLGGGRGCRQSERRCPHARGATAGGALSSSTSLRMGRARRTAARIAR